MNNIFIILLLCICALQLSCNSFSSHSKTAHFQQLKPDNQQKSVVKKSCMATLHCFEKIQAAIDAAPAASLTPHRILIDSGTYKEKIAINKNNVQLIGHSSKQTRITFGDYAGKEIEPGKPLGTPGSATVTLRAKDIILKHITIENEFNFLANDALTIDDPIRVKGSQAVALFIDAPSDKVTVSDVILLGNQDTLFVNSGRSWFDKVFIAGNVDYIFGNGNALFTESEIKTIARGKPHNPHGFVTAPSTKIASDYGLTFLNCRLTRDKSVPDNSVALGRPWHPTTTFSDGRYADPDAVGKSVFINTWMDAHITKDGWYSMSGTEKDGSRKNFMPEDARFFELNSKGPGANQTASRRQLEAGAEKKYTRQKIVGSWVE